VLAVEGVREWKSGNKVMTIIMIFETAIEGTTALPVKQEACQVRNRRKMK